MAPGRRATCPAPHRAQHLIRGRLRGRLRPGGLLLLHALLELLEPGPLLPDQVLEFRALLGRQDVGDLILHLLYQKRGRELDLAAVAGQLSARAPDDQHHPGALFHREVELVRKAAHELGTDLQGTASRPRAKHARLPSVYRAVAGNPADDAERRGPRSEEHTSELQSL